MKWLLPLLIAAPCLAQPIERWMDATTPDELIRITEDWLRGPDMPTIYAHAQYDGTNGAADGTITAPYTDLATAEAAMSAGDTLVMGGTFRETVTFDLDTLAIRGWTADEVANVPGATATRWVVRGDRIATGWAADGTYTNTFVPSTGGPASKPRGVVIDWDTRVWADGRHNAHLDEAANASACNSTAGTWYWNTDELLVNPPAGVTLSEHVVAWCGTGSGIILEGDNGTLTGGEVYLCVDTDSGNGYGVKGSAVEGWTITDVHARDCGYHHIGYAVGKCDTNWMVDCTAIGGNYTCDSYFICYSSSGDLANSGGINCVAKLSPLLKYTAVEGSEAFTDYIRGPSAAAPDQTAFGSHTGGSEVIANGGVLWKNCRVEKLSVNNTGYRCQVFSNGQDGTEPADKDDPATYSIRFVDCDLQGDWITIGQGTSSSNFTGSVAFDRCSIDLSTTLTSSVNSLGTPNSVYCNRFWVLLRSSTLVGETGSGTTAGLIRIRGTTNDKDVIRFSNSSIRAAGSTYCILNRMDGNTEGRSVQSVFSSASNILLYGGNTTASAGTYNHTKDWYGSTITAFGRGAAYDTQAEWASAVDANGVYAEDFTGQFADLATLEPGRGSRLATVRDITANSGQPIGVNGYGYVGNAGAWQLPLPAIADRGRGRDWRGR